MRIENSPIEFHPSCQFERLRMTEQQGKYLAFLRNKKSIYELVQAYLSKGWLVNFGELFGLIQSLATHNWIMNPEIVDYFKNVKLGAVTPISAAGLKNFSSPTDVTPLLQLPFFRALEKDFAESLLKQSKKYSLKAGTSICKTGDTTRDLYVVLSGQVGIYKGPSDPKHLIATLGVTSVFGEAAFLLGEKRTADVVTLRESEILVIPYDEEFMESYLNKDKASRLRMRFWVQHAIINSDFFKTLPADCLDALTYSGTIVELKQNHLLFREGDVSLAAYIVIQGALSIQKAGKYVTTLNQGAICGEVSLIATKGVRTATVMASKDTLLLEIHQHEFYKLMSQNLYLAKELELIAKQRLQQDAMR